MGPSMMAFFKEVYGRAKDADKFLMLQQPALKRSLNLALASSFWYVRLIEHSMCAATDAKFQIRIALHDNIPNPHVVAWQPYMNYASHMAAPEGA